MAMQNVQNVRQAIDFKCYCKIKTLVIAAALSFLPAIGVAAGGDAAARHGHHGYCSATARNQFVACASEVADDYFTANALCINVSDREGRSECFSEAWTERGEGHRLCGRQHTARRNLCGLLGEGRYDPDFDPASFDDDFDDLSNPNPYFPLTIGNQWEYEGGDETIVVEVLDKTKLIEGVTCIVVNDRVEEDGEPIEDTDDWFGQRLDGTVDYCGEISRNFELFEGDDPEEAELVDTEGSWKAGRDGAKPGTLFPGMPVVGNVYRQEFSAGDAEDVAKVLSAGYGYGSNPRLDRFVPQELAELLCAADDCVVTREFTPLEPGAFERKYYAPGIGLFLEVDPASGDIVQLVSCNFDARCADLPEP